MITHLREREKNLEPFGWNPQDAEWVALVCLHSGIFTRSQYMAYFKTYPSRARRFVQGLLDLKLAVEEPIPVIRRENRTRACRITHKGIYRELGVPNIRHRRFPDPGAISGGSCLSITSSNTQSWNGSRPKRKRFGTAETSASQRIVCRSGFTPERPGPSPGISP